MGSSLRTACFGALLAISGGAANAQQIVETSTGKHAEAPCSISEAMLAAIEDAEANRDADARARLDSLLQTALAGTRTRPSGDSPAHSPVVFPPVRPGS